MKTTIKNFFNRKAVAPANVEGTPTPGRSRFTARPTAAAIRGLSTRTTGTPPPTGVAILHLDDEAVRAREVDTAHTNQAAPGADIDQPERSEAPLPGPGIKPGSPGKRVRIFERLRSVGQRTSPNDSDSGRSYFRGFGVISSTFASTPFHSATKSAEPASSPSSGSSDKVKAATTLALSTDALRVPRATPAPSALLEALARPEHLQDIVRRTAASADTSPGSKRDAAPDLLLTALKDTRLDASQTAIVAMTLRTQFAGSATPIADACDALATLRTMDLLGRLRGSTESINRPTDEKNADSADKAWRLAQSLSAIPGGEGMKLIKSLGPTSNRPPNVHSSIDIKEQAVLRSFLIASAQLTAVVQRGGHTLGNDPASLFASPHLNLHKAIAACGEAGWPGRHGKATPAGIPLMLAEKALLAAKEELHEIDRHVSSPVTQAEPFDQGTHGCRFALAMMRGNMPTDEDRNIDGSASEFRRVESRTSKATRQHLDRAVKHEKGLGRVADALRDHLLPNRHKSPFQAYNKLVADDTTKKSSANYDNAGMTLSHRSPIADGRAFSDMIGTLEAAIATHLQSINPLGFDALINHAPLYGNDGKIDCHRLLGHEGAPLLQQLARASILKTTRAETLLLPRFARPQKLSPEACQRAIQDVLAQIRAPQDGFNMETLRAVIVETVQRENQPLTPSLMLRWGATVGGPANVDAVHRITEGTSITSSEWVVFAKGFDRIESGGVARADTPAMTKMSRHDAAELLARLVEQEELGSGFSLSNGGNLQASTRNASGVVSSALLGLTSSIRIDLGGGKTRLVTFESATAADRSALRFGVLSLKRVQVGAGGSIGHSVGEHTPVTLSAGSDAGYAFQVTDQHGAVFGFPRHLSGGVAGDRLINAEKAKLVRLLFDDQADLSLPVPGNPEDAASLVKRAYQAFGDRISIGRYESKTTDHIATVDITGTAGLRAGAFKLGLPTTHLTGLGQGTKTQYREHSGWLTNEKDTITRNYKLSADGTLVGFSGLAEEAKGDVSGLLQITAGSGAAKSADFFRYGETDVQSSILSEGVELPTSFASRSYSNPAAFVASLSHAIDQIANDKSQRFFAGLYADETKRPEIVAKEKEAIADLVSQYLREKDLTATPQLYWEFGSNNATANSLRAARHLAEKNGDQTVATQASSELTALHTDTEYREGRFLINAKLRSRATDTGVNGILGINYSLRNRFTEQNISFT